MKKLLTTFMLLTPLIVNAMDDLHVDLNAAHSALLDAHHPGWRASTAGSPVNIAFHHGTSKVPSAVKALLQTEDDLKQVNEKNRLRNAFSVSVDAPTNDGAAVDVGGDGVPALVVPTQLPWDVFAASPEVARIFEDTKVSVTRTVEEAGQSTEVTQDYSLADLFRMLRDDETIDATWDFGGHPKDFLGRVRERVLTPRQLSSLFQETVIVPLTKIANSATAGRRRAEKELRDIARKVTAEVFSNQGVKNKGKSNERPKLIVHADHTKAEDAKIGDLLATLAGELQLVEESIKGKATSKTRETRAERNAARKSSKDPIRHLLKKYKGVSGGTSREALHEYLLGLQTTLSDKTVYRLPDITPKNFSFDAEAKALLPVANALIGGVRDNPTLVPFMTVLGIAPYVDFTRLDFTGLDSFDALFDKLNADLAVFNQPMSPIQGRAPVALPR